MTAKKSTAKKARKRTTAAKKSGRKTTRKKTARKSSNTARAMWKGVLQFGAVEVPVKLYSAVQDRDIHFRLLHEKDKQPVVQHMVNPETGDTVPSENIRKAYQDGDVLVILEEEELEELEPESSRDIEISHFVDPQAITHQFYDRPYYLGPDGNNAAYFALNEALVGQNKHGIARWVMRNKEYVGAVVAQGDYLMLITMRYANEVVPASALDAPAGRKPDPREIKMAEQLVAGLESDFDPEEFRDEYRDRLTEFIEKKAKGKAPKVRKLKPKIEATDALTAALQASLKTMQKERKSA